MAREFKLPDLGEGIHEGEIVEVFVQPGDSVREGDPLLEVETDKAVAAIPSPFTGQVSEVRVRPGDVVTVGDVLVVFDAAGTDTEATPPVPENATAGAATESMKDRPGEDRPGLRTRPPVPAAPSTRRLARKLGVALAAVAPTGPEGLVTAEDVRRHAEEGAQTPVAATGADRIPAATIPPVASPDLPDFSRWGPVTAEPLRSVRRTTARQMALAWSQIPHVANQDEADVTRLEAWRKRHAAEIAAEDGRLTMTVLAAKAAVAALKRFPRFNASLDMAGAQIIHKHYHHVGVAVDSARGLIVPVLKDVDRRSIRELACDFNALVDRARGGQDHAGRTPGGHFHDHQCRSCRGRAFHAHHQLSPSGHPGARPRRPQTGGPQRCRGRAPGRSPADDAARLELRSPHRRRGRRHPLHAGDHRHARGPGAISPRYMIIMLT